MLGDRGIRAFPVRRPVLRRLQRHAVPRRALLDAGAVRHQRVRADLSPEPRRRDASAVAPGRLERLERPWDNEYWVVTTTDGTKYYFGADHVPGYSSSPATNSAWGEPVYNPVSGNPCYSASSGNASWCTMGYRWNLDFVVDPRGNLTEYNYATETNYYNRGAGQASGNNGTLTQYVRDGYPVSASYGMLPSDEQKATPVKPAAEVLFGYAQRCLPVGSSTCSAYSNLTSSTASDWPDIPFSEICQIPGPARTGGRRTSLLTGCRRSRPRCCPRSPLHTRRWTPTP